MSVNPTELLRAYKNGLGFKPNDVLRPRASALHSASVDHAVSLVKDQTVIVLRQITIIPHLYDVIGERENPSSPAERFVKLEINGHDWEKVGTA